MITLAQKIAAEAIGTALLLTIVVGSGIMAEKLAMGNHALALLANAIATGCGLAVLILIFTPISGAHFNPLVTLLALWRKDLSLPAAVLYLLAQFISAIAGVALAHIMFDHTLFALGQHERTGIGQWVSEIVASSGLLLTILLCSSRREETTATAVGAYIAAAYWFTASTSFANPAVTLARAFTDSFAGIRFDDVPAFVIAQCLGMVLAYAIYRKLRSHS